MPQTPPSPPSPATLPGVERRRQLRRQRRLDRLQDGWRILVYGALAAGLGVVLLREGWMLQGPGQVDVSGSRLVSREQVIAAAGLRFPQPLFSLQPRLLSRTLAESLPVERVRVSRLMLPPRLRVELVDRQAVARALRRTAKGPEQGFVDRTGNWINADANTRLRLGGKATIDVIGWNERNRPALGKVLEARESIGPGLREIRFEPDGNLWLTTGELGALRLGPVDSQLSRRLQVVAHLNRNLPQRLVGQRPVSIDLTDPEQPELTLQGASSTTANGPAPGARPPGRPHP
ncbi:MAG: FtsQ-type POTRA domain-containing protein [Cyanobacteriota bacterium]|nr:FtsQ-type POTRA domain-containing protein [Cyanobacteriota bacterium]